MLLLFVLMFVNGQENSYSPEICELQIWPEIILWKIEMDEHLLKRKRKKKHRMGKLKTG